MPFSPMTKNERTMTGLAMTVLKAPRLADSVEEGSTSTSKTFLVVISFPPFSVEGRVGEPRAVARYTSAPLHHARGCLPRQ